MVTTEGIKKVIYMAIKRVCNFIVSSFYNSGTLFDLNSHVLTYNSLSDGVPREEEQLEQWLELPIESLL